MGGLAAHLTRTLPTSHSGAHGARAWETLTPSPEHLALDCQPQQQQWLHIRGRTPAWNQEASGGTHTPGLLCLLGDTRHCQGTERD